MKHLATRLVASAALLAATPALAAGFETGTTLPDLQVTDTAGTVHNLADFRGQNVVLEWTNHGCPYVKKHYSTDNMQTLQREAAADDVVWLSVVSSAPGKQGHVSPAEADELTASRAAAPAAVILDPEGTTGRTFDAKTTPHMYIVDGEGVLRYQGAIDDNSSSNPATVRGATNYVRQALAEIDAGQPVSVSDTQAYGCSVKY